MKWFVIKFLIKDGEGINLSQRCRSQDVQFLPDAHGNSCWQNQTAQPCSERMSCNITAFVLWGAQRGAWNSTVLSSAQSGKMNMAPPWAAGRDQSLLPELTMKDFCLLPTEPDCEWVDSSVPGAITKQILKSYEIEVKQGYLSGNAGTQGVYACRVTQTLLTSSVGFCSFLTQRWSNWEFLKNFYSIFRPSVKP